MALTIRDIAMAPLLAVDNLHLWYDAGGGNVVRAVDGVSFNLEQRGEALGIIGESGSGKSSLAIALMRLLPRNVARFDGSVRLDGRELTALPEDEFRREIRWQRMAMVFQGAMSVLNPVVRIGDQVGERLLLDGRYRQGCRPRSRARAARAGRPAGRDRQSLPARAERRAKQRVVIASALTLDPDVLILDEPTSALDVSVQAQIMNLLKDLKEDPGMSMLFITHDIGLASDLCDRIAVAYAGEQMELGPAERVLVDAAPPVLPAPAGLVAAPSFGRSTPADARRPA